MRWLLFALVAVALSGCFEDQKQQLAKCELGAKHEYPTETPYWDWKRYIELCMRAAGYDLVVADKRCKTFPLELDPYCYVPSRPLARWLLRMEIGSEPY